MNYWLWTFHCGSAAHWLRSYFVQLRSRNSLHCRNVSAGLALLLVVRPKSFLSLAAVHVVERQLAFGRT
ncbi:hypothetical protein ACFW9L_16760 [Streptomyces sp. NPDC059517]|uniref:hypothetical protein n=1 Tax=Streptomyces sp. NPDC059517 TaxID=3346855 RepID=UPI003677B544